MKISSNHKNKSCTFCGVYDNITEHHLIPRTLHRKKWFAKNFSWDQMKETIPVCADCHQNIHTLIPSEKELGRSFNTVEKLLEHPSIKKFLEWKNGRLQKNKQRKEANS